MQHQPQTLRIKAPNARSGPPGSSCNKNRRHVRLADRYAFMRQKQLDKLRLGSLARPTVWFRKGIQTKETSASLQRTISKALLPRRHAARCEGRQRR